MHARYLRHGVETPGLATMKDFFRFYIAISRPRSADNCIVDLMGSTAEFFAAFTRVTGTVIQEDNRSEVYGVSLPLYKLAWPPV